MPRVVLRLRTHVAHCQPLRRVAERRLHADATWARQYVDTISGRRQTPQGG
jgi:hypothetical protein